MRGGLSAETRKVIPDTNRREMEGRRKGDREKDEGREIGRKRVRGCLKLMTDGM